MKLSFHFLFSFSILFSFSYGSDWPNWRGTNRDGLSKETGLLQEWQIGGPPKRWTTDQAGLGYSGFSISNGQSLFDLE